MQMLPLVTIIIGFLRRPYLILCKEILYEFEIDDFKVGYEPNTRIVAKPRAKKKGTKSNLSVGNPYMNPKAEYMEMWSKPAQNYGSG